MPIVSLNIDLTPINNFQGLPREKNQMQPGATTFKQPVLPEVIWAMNTVPSERGIQSANFVWQPLAQIPQLSNVNSNLYRIVPIVDVQRNLSYALLDDSLTTGQRRDFYLLNSDKQWQFFVGDNIGAPTFFHLKHTLFQNRTLFIWTLDDVLGAGWTRAGNLTSENCLVEVDLTTRVATFYEIKGIPAGGSGRHGLLSWGNYVIFFNAFQIWWSNPLDFSDFTPSVGGGGSAQIADAKGAIITACRTPRGFLLYCQDNIVSAEFSGDTANPWIFSEVPGGSGVIIRSGLPLITYSENSEFQIALTKSGLLLVSHQGCQPMPEQLNKLLMKEFTEHKEPGSSRINRHFYPESSSAAYKFRKVKRMELYGDWFFAMIGSVAPTSGNEKYNRLLGWNMQTQETMWIDGDIINITPALDLTGVISGSAAQHLKVGYVPNSYILTKRVDRAISTQDFFQNVMLDLSNATSLSNVTDPLFAFRDPEFMVSRIQATQNRRTRLHRVRFYGRIGLGHEEDEPLPGTRIRVFVYCKERGTESPVEFIYEPGTRSFVGDLEGSDLKVEVRGQFFDLYEATFEVSMGGYLD